MKGIYGLCRRFKKSLLFLTILSIRATTDFLSWEGNFWWIIEHRELFSSIKKKKKMLSRTHPFTSPWIMYTHEIIFTWVSMLFLYVCVYIICMLDVCIIYFLVLLRWCVIHTHLYVSVHTHTHNPYITHTHTHRSVWRIAKQFAHY